MKLVTVAEMQAIERAADAAGLTYAHMMENAGRGLGEVVAEEYAGLPERTALGLVGSGNNGGDTLVALAYLQDIGWQTSAYLARPRPADDPLVARFTERGGKALSAEGDADLSALSRLIREHAVLLDGVLGTGMRLPLQPGIAALLARARDLAAGSGERLHVVAVDCPSGVDCDSGEAAAEAIPAELTVTMAAVKTGLLKLPGYEYVGRLRVVGIGLAEDLPRWAQIRRMVVEPEWVAQNLPARPLDAHKGTFGAALVAAGCTNYTGAALLAGKAAYLSGAGLVTLAVPRPLHAVLAGHFPEATWLPLPDDQGVIAGKASDLLLAQVGKASALLIGPGFGLEETTRQFISRVLQIASERKRPEKQYVDTGTAPGAPRRIDLPPLVMDADGLKLLAQLPGWPGMLPTNTVLTPHPGEMGVLTSLSPAEIQADRIGLAERCAKEWGHVVVLKGAFSVIAAPDGRTALIPVASAALARAGTGDVLAGLIAGLRAQGVGAFEAAAMGAWIHAQAGLRAARWVGSEAAVLAGDILDGVVEVMGELAGGINPAAD